LPAETLRFQALRFEQKEDVYFAFWYEVITKGWWIFKSQEITHYEARSPDGHTWYIFEGMMMTWDTNVLHNAWRNWYGKS
jgi:hypothetical protein